METFHEDDIIVDPRLIPTFRYEKLRNDGTIYNAKYFPDVLIVNENNNFLIEVKSEWTYKIDVVNVHKKIDSVRESGYDIELWIYNSSKTHPIKNRYQKI